MPEERQETQAESPTAAQVEKKLEDLTPKEMKEWRQTGKLPSVEAKTEESPTSSEPPASEAKAKEEKKAETESASPPDKTVPEEDEAKAKERAKEKTEKRFSQLLARNKALERELEQLKAREPEKAVSESTPVAPKLLKVLPPEVKAKVDALIEASDQFERYEDFIAALLLELSEVTLTPKLQKAIEEREKAQETAKAQEKIQQSFLRSCEESKARHSDWEQRCTNEEFFALLPKNSPLNALIVDSPLAGEIFYHLAVNPEEIDRIAGLSAPAMGREIGKLEVSLSKSPVQPKEKAPPPLAPLATGRGKPGDEVSAALQSGNYEAYRDAANRRDLEERRA